MEEYRNPWEIKLAHDGRQYERIYLEDLADIGFADGYADLPNDIENIRKEIERRKIQSQNDKEDYLEKYQEGYDIGADMSLMAPEIYDEDGQLKEEYDV